MRGLPLIGSLLYKRDMGLFSRIFGGGGKAAEPEATTPAEPEPEPTLEAVIVLRRGMKVPAADYLQQVLAGAFPGGLPEKVHRIGLSQPSWFKTEEIADSMAGDVASTFALKFSLGAYHHRRRVLTGPEGAPLMLIELFRE
jgi:hypothetical protein